jgi:hypothetical protein
MGVRLFASGAAVGFSPRCHTRIAPAGVRLIFSLLFDLSNELLFLEMNQSAVCCSSHLKPRCAA